MSKTIVKTTVSANGKENIEKTSGKRGCIPLYKTGLRSAILFTGDSEGLIKKAKGNDLPWIRFTDRFDIW
ncbi:MAG: hypothetical protein N2645_22605 [Clostridia bacterium]|nr:hypothetical protein [Clostridia bacterium]